MNRPPLRMGLLVVLGALAALGTAAPASADVLYAAPDGTEYPAYGCTDPQEPCEMRFAIEQASQPGDEVIVAPGEYTVDESGSLFIDRDRYVHGADGQPRPRLRFLSDSGALGVNPGARVRYLALESSGPEALFLRGDQFGTPAQPAVGEDLLVSATGSVGAESRAYGTASASQGAVLRDSVVTAHGDGTSAVLATDGRADLRNVTAIATGPSSVGIHAANVPCTPVPFRRCYSSCESTGEIAAKNSIARGTFADIRATDNCDGPATLGISYSNFRVGTVSYSGGAITIGEGNQTRVDPLFVDAAAGDFHQMPTSPTIDAGTGDPLLGATDIDGQARRLGLRPDIGADEARAAYSKGRCVSRILGTAADDDLSGTARGDRIRGLGGDDLLKGLAGADCLAGAGGEDKLEGGRGEDKLVGGGGENSYQAGPGNDGVVAANSEKELVGCGRGKNDRAVVDQNDAVVGCEYVTRR